MLQDEDMLDAVDVKIDYLMSGSSLAEHGYNLIDVNRYELCAQNTVEQSEWWPFTACMYSMQACLSYNTTEEADAAGQSCSNAESGADDDVAIAGLDSVSDSCECTVEGVASECASEYITSSTFETLKECVNSDEGVEYADKSKKIAEAANSGSPLWIKVDNITMYDSVNEADTIESWAQTVFSSACNRIEYLGGTKPKSCDTVTANSISKA
mmetsp:Transcript_33598/g.77620  ORF Transcript_33598/g.77620 Transcript_33598/m.77620 type:complete len:212 (-) Transcript_33598:575-1210(-)